MARFIREYFDNDVPGDEMWKHITDYIKDGSKSVEILSRVIKGEKKWEQRAWDGVRKNGSNAADASPNMDY